MRAGPQLGVDAFSISNYGSAMFAQVQPQHSPLMLLTPKTLTYFDKLGKDLAYTDFKCL